MGREFGRVIVVIMYMLEIGSEIEQKGMGLTLGLMVLII